MEALRYTTEPMTFMSILRLHQQGSSLCAQWSNWLLEIQISASLTNASHVCCCICSVDIPPYEAHWVQTAPKVSSSFIALPITFIFFAWRLSKELILFFWMAEGSQANPVEQLLPCCTAPTTIQIGSWLEGICMLLEWHSSLQSWCVLYDLGSCWMSILLEATERDVKLKSMHTPQPPQLVVFII